MVSASERMVKCPECKSDDIDYSTVGLVNAMQCLNCGYVLAVAVDWPFPTSLVNKPLNDITVKIEGLKDAQEAPL